MTTLKKPVVVGIGDKQPTLIRFALGEAQRTGAELRVVHSAAVPVQARRFYVGEELSEDIREEGQKVLDAAEHFIMQEALGVPVKFVLTSVAPTEALEAEAAEASMLVIGADDLSWPERLLGGAIAAHVAKHATCPVVVVPERSYVTPLGGGVVLALDGDTASPGPLRFAFEEASGRDKLLHVLHATPPATLAGDAETIRANVPEVVSRWSENYPDVHVHANFPIDDAEDAFIRATEDSGLVVVERSHQHSAPFGLARPLATKILKRTQCPVAVVPADYQGA